MQMQGIPFGTADRSEVAPTRHAGEATWRTRQFDDIRLRMVADGAGPVLLWMAGERQTELADGRGVVPKPGMSYQVADRAEPHRSRPGAAGASLFVVH